MRVSSDLPDYSAIADAIRATEAVSQVADIIPPSPLAPTFRPVGRSSTRLIAFPTAAIEDAELATSHAAVARDTAAPRAKPVTPPAKRKVAGSLANLSRALNALLVVTSGISGLAFGGAMGPQFAVGTPRHLELSSVTESTPVSLRPDANATTAGITAAWLELRRTSTTTSLSPPNPVLTWASLHNIVVSEDVTHLVRVASIALASHTDVPVVMEAVPIPLAMQVAFTADESAIAPNPVPAWVTTAVPAALPAAPLAGAPSPSQKMRKAQPSAAPAKATRSSTRKAPEVAKPQIAITTPSALGATRQQTAVERPARQQTAKSWTAGAFESSR